MIDLLLAVACSLAIGVIFKVAAQQGMDRLALLTVNYAAALLLAVGALHAAAPAAMGFAPSPGLVALGVATGALFIAGFFTLAWATEVAGLSLAVAVMRVSVVIPFLASWLIWDERPTPAQGLGLIVAGIAFFLIARREPTAPSADAAVRLSVPSPGRVVQVLALLFLAGGLVDVSLKTFDEVYAAVAERDAFLVFVFGVAFVIGLGLVLRRGVRTGIWPPLASWLWGAGLGLANYGSAVFILRAIRQLSGPVVFPANNVALMIGAALLGVLVWQERLSRLN
ncbi:MAG: hypothetical protein D6685_13795, partial [Bacteroidetes bacterium]